MKQIYTLLTAAFILAGTTLWSGCSNDDLLSDNDKTPNTGTSQQAVYFTFNLKGQKANTRAIGTISNADLNYELESAVKTVYVAFFQKDAADPTKSPLHRIYCCDTDNKDWGDKPTFTGNAENGYKIEKPGTIGNYIVYFIANPDDVIKTQLAAWQTTSDNVTLASFEADLYTDEGTADGATSGTSSPAVGGSERGFIMVGKEDIVLETSTQKEVALTRLAARFDFINSAISGDEKNEVKITKIDFNYSGKKSIVATATTETVSNALETIKSIETGSGVWDSQSTTYFTTYMYENTNTETGCTSIDVYYTLTDESSNETKKKLRIDLKGNEKNIGVTRNHLYRIYLNGISATYTLVVKDWTTGETVTVPNEDLAITYKATDLGKVGDIAYINGDGNLAFFDGGLRALNIDGTYVWKLDERRKLTDNEQSKCIGIVFSNSTTQFEKENGFTRGQVMALANFGTQKDGTAYWKTEDTDDGNFKISTEGDMVGDCNGYLYCTNIKAKADFPAKYPALGNLQNWSVKVPTSTSGWYVPSLGQLFAIYNNLSSWKIPASSKNNFEEGSSWAQTALESNTKEINSKMSIVSNYTPYYGRFITSSEGKNAEYQMVLNNKSTDHYTYQGNLKKSDQDVNIRPVFAF